MSCSPNVTLSAIAAAVCVLCTIPSRAAPVSWITEANSFWDIATNWSPGLPGSGDDVLVDVAGARVITLRAAGGPFAVNSLFVGGDNALTITSGSLTIHGLPSADNATGASSLARLTQTGGTVAGAGQITIVGAASLASSTHTGSGSTILQGTTALNGLNLDAGRSLRNEGTATLTGAMNLNPTNTAGAGRIENAAGALFDVRTFNLSITASSFADDAGTAALISNAGTFRKGTPGSYGVGVAFSNLATGSIDVQVGSFNFTGGGSHSGSVALATGTSLVWTGGTHDVNAGATFTGDGTLQLAGGAIVDLNAATTVASRFTQGTGTLRGADLILAGAATLNSGVHSGAGSTTLQESSTWSGFKLDGGRVLKNEGVATVLGGLNLNATNTAGAGRIENTAGGVIDVRTFNLSMAASSFTGDTGADASITNAGTFRKSTAGSYGVGVPFINLATGTIDVQSGSFSFTGGGTYSGAALLSTGAALNFSDGTHAITAGASFVGPGTLAVAGASTVLDLIAATKVGSAFSMTGGTVEGADLTLTGPVSIAISSSLGVMSGAATTTLEGISSVGGGANNPFGLDAGRVLRNEGSMVITGVLDLNRLSDTGSGRIENAAGALIDVKTFNQSIFARDWTAINSLDNGSDARVINAGTFRKSSTGTYSVLVPFFNTGTVEVLAGAFNIPTFSNAGVVDVAAGTSLQVSGAGFVNTGSIQGNGTVVAPGAGVINSGSIGPGDSPGHLTIDGDLFMTSGGAVSIELNGISQFDLLTVTGEATLAGELEVIRMAGYTPAVGDIFVVMTFYARLGSTFDEVSFLGFGNGVQWDVSYRDQELVLGVTAVPEPAVWGLLLFGLGLLGVTVRWRRVAPSLATP